MSVDGSDVARRLESLTPAQRNAARTAPDGAQHRHRAREPDRAARGRRAGSAVLRAGASVAAQPGVRRRHRLQRAGRLPARGPARPRAAAARARRHSSSATRSCAPPTAWSTGTPMQTIGAVQPIEINLIDLRGRPADEQQRRVAADPQGGVALPVRPRQRPGDAPDGDPPRRRRAHPDAQHAPHRDRRLLAQRPLPRPDRALRGVRPRPAVAARRRCRSSTPTTRSGSVSWLDGGRRRRAARVLEAQARAARLRGSTSRPTSRARRCARGSATT